MFLNSRVVCMTDQSQIALTFQRYVKFASSNVDGPAPGTDAPQPSSASIQSAYLVMSKLLARESELRNQQHRHHVEQHLSLGSCPRTSKPTRQKWFGAHSHAFS